MEWCVENGVESRHELRLLFGNKAQAKEYGGSNSADLWKEAAGEGEARWRRSLWRALDTPSPPTNAPSRSTKDSGPRKLKTRSFRSNKRKSPERLEAAHGTSTILMREMSEKGKRRQKPWQIWLYHGPPRQDTRRV